jgi:integrase
VTTSPSLDEADPGHVAGRALVADPWGTASRAVGPGDLALRSWAPSTVDAYNEDWRTFTAWCRFSVGLVDPFDADEFVVAEYVAAMVRDRLAYATIGRRLAAIAFAFDVVARRPSPTRSRLVRRVVRRAAHTLGTTPRRAEPLTLAQLHQILGGLALVRPDQRQRTAVRRDQLLFALGWAAALRPGELIAVDADDLTFTDDADSGDGGMLVRIRRSKGDRQGGTDYVAVRCARQAATCPVRLAQRATRRLRTGPLFVHLDRHGESRGRLGVNAVSRVVKATVADVLHLDPTRYSGQSLRAGFVTEARSHGVPDDLIARHTRHRCIEILDVYDKPGALLAQSAFGTWW